MGTWVIRMAAVATLFFVLGPLLAMLGAIAPMRGFGLFAFSGLLSLVTLILGIVGLARGKGGATGVLLSGLITVVFLAVALPGRDFPRINDITTDTLTPPQFVHATTLPGNEGRDLKYPGATFAEQQQQGYPDLKGLRLSLPPDEAFRKVVAAAKTLPNSEVTYTDQSKRVVEGLTTSRLFRFQDDFIVEVREDSDGCQVHMRSKSRVGRGDIGANAARIQALFAKLQ